MTQSIGINAKAKIILEHNGQEYEMALDPVTEIFVTNEVGDQILFDDFTAVTETGKQAIKLTGYRIATK